MYLTFLIIKNLSIKLRDRKIININFFFIYYVIRVTRKKLQHLLRQVVEWGQTQLNTYHQKDMMSP